MYANNRKSPKSLSSESMSGSRSNLSMPHIRRSNNPNSNTGCFTLPFNVEALSSSYNFNMPLHRRLPKKVSRNEGKYETSLDRRQPPIIIEKEKNLIRKSIDDGVSRNHIFSREVCDRAFYVHNLQARLYNELVNEGITI